MSDIYMATSTRADGNMGFRFGEHGAVSRNRNAFLQKHTIDPTDHICMVCDHSDTILSVDRQSPGIGATDPNDMPEAEVLVTKEKGLALMLLTADCIPLILHDPEKEVIALAHVSRATLGKDLVQKTVRFLREHYESEVSDLHAHLGPHIKKESYAFELPVPEPPPPELKPFTMERDGSLHIDMEAACIAALESTGVHSSHIHAAKEDTANAEHYFSHYQSTRNLSTPEGRMATIVLLLA